MAELETTERGSKKVNFIAGRFQPITKGHLRIAREMYDDNGLPTVFVIVRGQKSKRSPIPLDLTQEMVAQTTQRPYVKDYVVSESAFFFEILLNLRESNYEPVYWGAGPDREKEYQKQLDNLKNEIVPPAPEAEVFSVRRFGGISATKIRNAIIEDDTETFEEGMPKEIVEYKDELKRILSPK